MRGFDLKNFGIYENLDDAFGQSDSSLPQKNELTNSQSMDLSRGINFRGGIYSTMKELLEVLFESKDIKIDFKNNKSNGRQGKLENFFSLDGFQL